MNYSYHNEPETLVSGKRYILSSEELTSGEKKVVFLAYTSSPEDVIVLTSTGRKLRVSRCNLYEEYNEK